MGDEGVMSVSRLTKVSLKTGPSHNFDTTSLVTVLILRLLTTNPRSTLFSIFHPLKTTEIYLAGSDTLFPGFPANENTLISPFGASVQSFCFCLHRM